MIDSFSKFATVVILKSKQIPDMLAGILEGFQNMGGKPDTIYSDDEGALNGTVVQDFFKEQKIDHTKTRTHPMICERFIRTVKSMLHKRMEHTKKDWKELLFQVLLTYNNKLEHSTTGYTPKEAHQRKILLMLKSTVK